MSPVEYYHYHCDTRHTWSFESDMFPINLGTIRNKKDFMVLRRIFVINTTRITLLANTHKFSSFF